MPEVRWPIHPSPSPGESLSSWLGRIAAVYRIGLVDLLDHLDYRSVGITDIDRRHLDIDPPARLIRAIEARTGCDRAVIRAMTLEGSTPWLLDTVTPSRGTEGFETFVYQHQVLLERHGGPSSPVPSWVAWLPSSPLYRACPSCARGPHPVPGRTLVSQLPLTLSCPTHGCYLENVNVFMPTGVPVFFGHGPVRPAPSAVRVMDSRTHQALSTGSVHLLRRHVHAGIWFRLLRTIIDELSTSLTHAGRQAETIREIWARVGLPPRGGPFRWHLFESLDWAKQSQYLKATAVTISLIENGSIVPTGNDGMLFRPLSQRDIERSSAWPPPRKHGGDPRPAVDYWREIRYLAAEVVAEAKARPVRAEALYQFVAGLLSETEAHQMMLDLGIANYASSLNRTILYSRMMNLFVSYASELESAKFDESSSPIESARPTSRDQSRAHSF